MVRLDEMQTMISSPLLIPSGVVQRTIDALQEAGERHSEGIVLWLGQRAQDHVRVLEAFVPIYVSASDYFRIPTDGMEALLEHLANSGNYVASQVHSHPHEAFHSRADDNWAIVRHLDALSVVLPYFAGSTTIDNFLQQAAVFRLDEASAWIELSEPEAAEVIRIR
jgi:proteasome lid subunit RPN8/RPN11